MTPHFKKTIESKSIHDLMKIREYVEKLINKKALPDMLLDIQEQQYKIILHAAASFWDIPPDSVFTKRRFLLLKNYRHAVRYAIKIVTGMSYQHLGEMLNCNHATIIHSVSFVEESALTNTSYFNKCEMLCAHLRKTILELKKEEHQKQLLKNLKTKKNAN
jgi:chromosomal replication initiation ATPase DnaA